MVKDYEIPDINQLKTLSMTELRDTVQQISQEQGFVDQHSLVEAIIDIVTIIHSSYEEQEISIEKILLALRNNAIPRYRLDITKSDLAKKPLVVQISILMQRLYVYREKDWEQQVLWLAITMHTAVLLKHHKKKTAYNNILMQFKLAVFFTTESRRWIWNELLDYQSSIQNSASFGVENTLSTLAGLSERIEQELTGIGNITALDLIKAEENKDKDKGEGKDKDKYEDLLKTKSRQIQKILTAYEQAHYPNAERKNKLKKDNESNKEEYTDKPIKLSNESPNYTSPNEPSPYHWDTPKDDIEHYSPVFNGAFLEPETETHEGLAPSFEEVLDSYDTPYINYEQLPNELIRHSAPLQTIDLSLQQNYISQRELALNSNTRLLSLAGYQVLFKALSSAAKNLQTTPDTDALCAGILLLSLITALPVESLITEGYMSHSKVFRIASRRAYIQHCLGITKRSDEFDEEKYENESDKIKIPIPHWLITALTNHNIPSKEAFTGYLKLLRKDLELPYLSLARIESALHVILSRYTPDCNSHIANLICRTPAPHAAAMYYSSHSSEAVVAHYKSALSILNAEGDFDLSYITAWHKYTVGSSFALKLNYVSDIIEQLRQWVKSSLTMDEHFDRTSIYTWFVFCLLTGVRPNNGISKITDIDLDMGWLLIDDKPSKSARNHRLIPLCSTVIKHLKNYENYLVSYQRNNLIKHNLSRDVDQIRVGDEVSLLRVLSDSFDRLLPIKRGVVYAMTKNFIELDPYWTRHFVRTQLERLGVNIVLINGVIGHEKNRQEALGKFSSLSKAQIKEVGKALEAIAGQLKLNDDAWLPKWSV